MQIEPTAAAFVANYARGATQVVWTTLVADLETPVSAFLKTGLDKPLSFLLELVEGGAVRGRYSVIGLDPDVIFRVRAGTAEINRAALRDRNAFAPARNRRSLALHAFITESRFALPDKLPPMAAGVFGYLAYDMVRAMEDLAPPNPDPIGIPEAMLVRPTVVIIFDSVLDTLTLVTPARPRTGCRRGSGACARGRSAHRSGRGARQAARQGTRDRQRRGLADCAHLEHDARRIPRHRRAREGLHRGRRYFSGRARTAFRGTVRAGAVRALPRAPPRQSGAVPVLPRLRQLRRRGLKPRNPGAHAGAYGHGAPDRRHAAAGATPHDDKALEAELLADPKERAEHLMLLDLGRNDVGRVAAIGTVKVTDQFFIERYSQVMHIVSNVEGTLDPRRDALDALAAGFPAGTVSGAPKVRAMQIIDELEKEKRGALRRLRRLFLGRRRHGHLHRAAHGLDQGRQNVRPGRRGESSPTPIPRANSRNASTRRRHSSAPPRKRAVSPAPPERASERHLSKTISRCAG